VKLGGAQPKTLMPAEGGNERGYFESQALMAFHDELLASAGSDWTDWRPFNPAWYQTPTATAFQKRAKQLFKEEFDGEPLVVLKDPRVCRFAPFWLEVLARIKARARIVIPVRAPLEVAFSMQKRFGFSLATGALLWLRHIIDAEIASRALPRSIFTWDQLLGDWRSVAEKASTELGLRWPRLSDATAHEIENFIGYDLVHHRVSVPELAGHPDIHEWTIAAYRAMLKLARAPRSSSALKTLDKTRDAFNRASMMFGRTVLEHEIRSQDLLRQHDAARAELVGALQTNEQISLELNARERRASALAQALAEQGCQREQAELALARETELMVTEKTRRAIGARCDVVTLPPTSVDTLIIEAPEMLEVCKVPPQERPAQISTTSTPQELETYFRRAGYIQQHRAISCRSVGCDLWQETGRRLSNLTGFWSTDPFLLQCFPCAASEQFHIVN